MTALKAGVSLSSVRRPLKGTDVVCECFEKIEEWIPAFAGMT